MDELSYVDYLHVILQGRIQDLKKGGGGGVPSWGLRHFFRSTTSVVSRARGGDPTHLGVPTHLCIPQSNEILNIYSYRIKTERAAEFFFLGFKGGGGARAGCAPPKSATF